MRRLPNSTRIACRTLQCTALLALAGALWNSPESNAGGECGGDQPCSYLLPGMMLSLDYSTEMNQPFDNQLTRWERTVAAVSDLVSYDNGYFSENMRIAVMRVGHDPDPGQASTPIPGDGSGLIDGQAVDIAWYAEDLAWFGCMGDTVIQTLESVPAPMDGANDGIGAWHRGGVARVNQLVAQSIADHPEDEGERRYFNVLFAGSAWTGPSGVGQPAPHDPAPHIEALNEQGDVPTYVVRVGDGLGQQEADDWADKGGTVAAFDVDDDLELHTSIAEFFQEIKDDVIVPDCVTTMPRITVVLDASSDMLNVDGQPGAMGTTPWDQARELLHDSSEFWSADTLEGYDIEDLTHASLIVFGDAAPNPGEQRILVPMSSCNPAHGNFEWALDPATSCEQPGCSDPWGGPDIEWTFGDDTHADFECYFDPETTSHMPRCSDDEGSCGGSGRFVHLGISEALAQTQAYHAENLLPMADNPVDQATPYYNILVVGGSYLGYSTDAQVQSALAQSLDAGIVTFVLGVGEDAESMQMQAELTELANWGSGGQYPAYTTASLADLQAVLVAIVDAAPFDPCCGFFECSWIDPDQVCDDGGETGGDESDGGETGGEEGTDSGADTGTEGGEGGDSGGGGGDSSDDGAAPGETGDSSDSGGAASEESGLGRGCGCTWSSREPAPPLLAMLFATVAARRRRPKSGRVVPSQAHHRTAR